jgi:hypothetical protein
MTQRILKNNTGVIVPISDVGISVPAFGQYVIPPTQYGKVEDSDDVIGPISDLAVSPTVSTLTVNDGTFDLSISEGTRLIQGGFSRPISDGADPTIKATVNEDLTPGPNELHTQNRIRGASDNTLIGNVEDKLKVTGIFFEGESIEVEPKQNYQAFLNLTICLYREMIRLQNITNTHLAVLSDLEDTDVDTDHGNSTEI